MINRAAILLKYRTPAVEWINEADPYHDDPGITLETVNAERAVYLVDDEVAESQEGIDTWLMANHRVLFESELEGWYPDPALWPEDLSYNQFKRWFAPECHSVVVDTLKQPIVDDEL